MGLEQVVEAIHKLELCMTKQLGEQKQLLMVQNDRLDHLRIAVDRHREILFGHDDGDKPGLLMDMGELKKTEKERRLTLRGVTVAFMGLVGKFVYDIWNT